MRRSRGLGDVYKRQVEDGPYKNNIKGLFIEENRSQEEIEEIYDTIA